MNVEVTDYAVVPDDAKKIEEKLLQYADTSNLDLVVTTGGTGLGPRDTTPEVVKKIIDREITGAAEAARVYGQARTPLAMLSRSVVGVRRRTVIASLPGSKNGVSESLDALLPALLHVFNMMKGEGH